MLSSSGFRDALGERDLRFDRESGDVYERLLLRPELAAHEAALRRRVGRLASLEDPRLVPLDGIEHDPQTRRVAVVSRHVSGLRLHEILQSARTHEVIPDFTVALYVTGEVLAGLQALQGLSGVPHGALGPERVIITPDADVILADYGYAEVIEAVQFAPERLWTEFGIARWLGDPGTPAADVRQSALIAVALMLGRPLGATARDSLAALVAEVEDAAMIRGGRLLATPIVSWLRGALAAGHDGGFEEAADAAAACAALLTDRERAAARPALAEFLAELDRPPVTAREPAGDPGDVVVVSEEAVTAVQEPSADSLSGSEEPSFAHSVYEGPGPEFLPVTEPEMTAVDEAFPPPDSSLVWESAPAASPQATEDAAAPRSESAVPSLPAVPESVATAWPPPPAPALEISPDAGPRVVSPSPFAVARATAPTADGAATAAAIVEPPPVAMPVLPPHLAPLPILPAPVVGREAAGAPGGSTSEPPIRLKSDGPIRLKEHGSRRRDTSSIGLDLSERPALEETDDFPEADESTRWNIPWKYVAAAGLVLALGIAATQVDWGTSTQVEASRSTPPAPVAPPPAPKTGAVEVISNTPGARVLVDGKLRGQTPLIVENLSPGRHVVLVRAPNGNVRRTIRIVAGETTKLDLAVYSGWVIVSAPIELKIFENGKSIGTAGEGPIVLSSGHHTIEVANEALRYRSSHAVDIKPGEESRLELNPKGLANLNAVPWAEVWLDGARIGDTPLGNVAVSLGTRDFLFRHPQFGERRVSVTITGDEPAQVSVDFTK